MLLLLVVVVVTFPKVCFPADLDMVVLFRLELEFGFE